MSVGSSLRTCPEPSQLSPTRQQQPSPSHTLVSCERLSEPVNWSPAPALTLQSCSFMLQPDCPSANVSGSHQCPAQSLLAFPENKARPLTAAGSAPGLPFPSHLLPLSLSS